MKRLFFLTLFILSLSVQVSALKPEWVGNTPKELNNTYRFVEVVSYGSDIDAARIDAIHLLALNQKLASAAKVSVETGKLTHSVQESVNGDMTERITDQVDIKVSVSGLEYTVQASPVDEYVAGYENDRLKLHTLYMVAVSDDPVYDDTYLSTSYGAAPVFMSVIPGVGQWYKGCKAKGCCMLAAEVLSLSGVVLAENNRASYVKKITAQPKFAKEYTTRADNWCMARNVLIGTSVGICIWSMVDAAFAPGARKVEVRRSGLGDFSFNPMISADGAGLTLAFNF